MSTAAMRALAAAAFFLLGPPAATGTAAAVSPAACRVGLAEVQAGHLEQAQATYAAVRPPDPSCVRQGMTVVSALLEAR